MVVFARVRRVLLFVGLVFAAVPVGSALADTTVGQTGTPQAVVGLNDGLEAVTPSAVMPAPGTVTRFQFQSGFCTEFSGSYDFQVLHPLGNNQYQVLGDTGNQTNPCDGQLHSYPVNINVQAGDMLGVYVVSTWEGVLSPTPGSITFASIPEPSVGDTVTLPDNDSATLDESANLAALPSPLPSPPPTSKSQCRHGGWKSFGTMFKNQGDCVSFVATGGKNLPSGL